MMQFRQSPMSPTSCRGSIDDNAFKACSSMCIELYEDEKEFPMP